MAVNKVSLNTPDGEEVLIDLTGDTIVPSVVERGIIFHDSTGEQKTGTFTIDPELTEQDTLLAKLAKAVRYKAAGNIDLDPELTEQDALISNILTTLARKLPSKT